MSLLILYQSVLLVFCYFAYIVIHVCVTLNPSLVILYQYTNMSEISTHQLGRFGMIPLLYFTKQAVTNILLNRFYLESKFTAASRSIYIVSHLPTRDEIYILRNVER